MGNIVVFKDAQSADFYMAKAEVDASVVTTATLVGAADSAASAAAKSSEQADRAASEAHNVVRDVAENVDTLVDAGAPFPQLDGVQVATNWTAAHWTNDQSNNVKQGPELPDMASPVVTIGGNRRHAVIRVGERISRKAVIARRLDSDILLISRVLATGVGGQTVPEQIYIGIRGGFEDRTTSTTFGGSAHVLVEGVNILTQFIAKDDVYHSDTLRPYVLRASTGSPDVTVAVESLQVVPIVNNTVPLLAMIPPLRYGDDAQKYIQAAVNAAARIGAANRCLDMGGRAFSVGGPIEVRRSITIRNSGTITAIGTRSAWSGGTPDTSGVPRQMGIFRAMADGVEFDHVRLNCGAYTEIPVTDVPNTVYSQFRPLANGFEDAYVSGTTKARQLTLQNCSVNNWDDYGYRYSSGNGGGFNCFLNVGRKDPPQKVGPSGIMENADAQTGSALIVDSADGKVHNCTFFGGEYAIRQLSGGTIEFGYNHPWCGASAYNRKYYGSAGTEILTGIQVRTPTQIGAYDTSRMTVTRRESDWQVVVTLLVDIPIANAAPVLIRRDEVLARMDGWGSSWFGNYMDGGTIRCGTNGLRFFGGYGLPGAMGETVDGIPPTMLSAFEWYRSSDESFVPSQIHFSSSQIGASRVVPYPTMGQTSWPATMQWSAETMRARWGTQSIDAAFLESLDTDGLIQVFKSKRPFARVIISPNSLPSSDGIHIVAGAGDPEGVVSAPVGSQYRRTDGTPGATVYDKESGGYGPTGWVAK